jgi:hypothetical protein
MPPALVARIVVALLVAPLVAGCGADQDSSGEQRADGSPSLTLAPASPSAPAGRLTAELRQSSHYKARGLIEVWIENGTAGDITPARIVYRDPRLATPVSGDRLRPIPAGAGRGFALAIPPAVCPPQGAAAPLEVTYAGRTHRIPVDDSIDVVGSNVRRMCLLRRVSRVADLRWADRIEVDATGTGHLVLVVTPTGRNDDELLVESVNGTYLLGPPREPFWSPRVRVRGTGDPVRVRLPIQPVRCDPHAFMEGGTATTFRLHLTVAGRSGEITLPMSTDGVRATIDWAADYCHLGEPGAAPG